jgi:GTP-binding protein
LAEKRIFLDEAKLFVQGGRGGNGAVSLRHEKYAPRGGPDGGTGGRGGDVIILADSAVRTLIDFLHRVHFKAEPGRHGQGNTRDGRSGAHRTIHVPVGTVIRQADTGEVLADLTRPGQRCLVAKGGKGGRGNASFATATERTPRFAEKGEPGQEWWLRLEHKLLADVGLIGMPNAGKSTLLARVSAARPKIADYPFTTLAPVLGVVRAGEGRSFVMADLPGLIEGAHLGKGRGTRFLRHVERTQVLVHLLDLATPDRDPITDFRAISEELRLHDERLATLPQVVAANKIDLPQARERLPQVEAALAAQGVAVFPISAVTGEGVPALIYHVADLVDRAPRPLPAEVDELIVPDKKVPLGVERLPEHAFRVRGSEIERLVAMTDLENEEAVTHLHRQLTRAGAIRLLRESGAQEGDKVLIDEHEFDFIE